MKPIQHGYYINLMARAWDSDRPGTLPNDAEVLWKLARAESRKQFEKHSELVLAQFNKLADGKLLVHPRLIKERQKQLRFSRLQSARGAKGGNAKAHKELRSGAGLADAKPEGSRNVALRSSSSSSSSINTKPTTKPSAPAALTLSKDMAFETFKAKFGTPPAWDTSDYAALAALFKRIPTLAFEEFNRRWSVFLFSEDPFEISQGGRLRYFCANFDRFMQEAKPDATRTQQRTQHNADVVRRVLDGMDRGAGRALQAGTQPAATRALPQGPLGFKHDGD